MQLKMMLASRMYGQENILDSGIGKLTDYFDK